MTASPPIDRDYFEEKFKHLMTILAALKRGQEIAVEHQADCEKRCARDMDEVYTRLRTEETKTEVQSHWIQAHEKRASDKPHWVYAQGIWVKVVLTGLGMLGGLLMALWIHAAPHVDKLHDVLP